MVKQKEKPVTGTPAVEAQYSRGDLRERIEHALSAAGKNAVRPTLDDLAPLDEFHLLGRPAPLALAELASISANDRVLDLGAGLCGPARLLAHDFGAEVVAADLTPEYCAISEWLNDATGLSDRITVVNADALDLPFADKSFEVVWSQHAQMNVADKQRLYTEARRVLKDGGRLAIWDALAGPVQPIHFPVPWADTPELSFLATSDELRALLEAAGLEVAAWNDLSTEAAQFLHDAASRLASPLGLHVYVSDLPTKAATFRANIEEDRVRMLQALLLAR
jgi:sarcosine/dimethylglycine N-methyltransferase